MSFHRVSDFPGSGREKRGFLFPCFLVSAPPLGGGKLETRNNSPKTPAEKLTEIASQVARLTPCHRDPEAFHIQKSEIIAMLRRLAREAGR